MRWQKLLALASMLTADPSWSDDGCAGGRDDVADGRFFDAATRRFDRDWARAAHLVRHCPACAGFPAT